MFSMPGATVTPYQQLRAELLQTPRKWLITGVAGFMGSHLLQTLLQLNQQVVGMDNLSTGYKLNLVEVQGAVSAAQWNRFQFIEGDIRDLCDCMNVCQGVDHVLHQAALDSHQQSVFNPIHCHEVNVTGFLNMLVAARNCCVKSFTYAASNAIYGDHPGRPQVEEAIGTALTPYAVTKHTNELYANVFARTYGFCSTGLRYFNVFGPRQDPQDESTGLVSLWTSALLKGEPVYIEGDGEISRDFCFVDNAVQATLLAAMAQTDQQPDNTNPLPPSRHQIYNVAVGERTTLNSLFHLLRDSLKPHGVSPLVQPRYCDIPATHPRHSMADVSKARQLLGYVPSHSLEQGVNETVAWASSQSSQRQKERKWISHSLRTST